MSKDSALVYPERPCGSRVSPVLYAARAAALRAREITLSDTAGLLMAAAGHGVAKVEVVGVRAPST